MVYHVKDSTVFYRSINGTIKSFGANSGTIIHTKEFIKQYQGRVNNNVTYLIIFVIISVIIISLLLLIFKVRKKAKLSDNQTNEGAIIEKKLITFRDSTITKEKLDEIFDISHYSYETIKTRRSMIINHINKNGNIAIVRVRKKDDKRFYNYKIS